MAKKKRLIIMLALLAILVGFFIPVHVHAAEGDGFGYITLANTRSTCAIREEPSSRSAALFYLKHGTGVTLISSVANAEGYWYEIKYTNGNTGYVLSEWLNVTRNVGKKPASNAEGQPTFGYITLTNTQGTCAVRAEPDSRSEALFYLKHGTGVKRISTVTNNEGPWYKIEYTKDKQGYVPFDRVSLKGATNKPAKDTQTNCSAESQSTFGYITLSNTRSTCAIRKEPSSRSAALFYLKHGTGVKRISTVTNNEGTWYEIEYTKDKKGYVPCERVSLKSATNTPAKDTETNSSSETNNSQKDGIVQVNTKLMVRSKPSTTSYEVLEYLFNGYSVTILETSSDRKWKKVETESGKIGWCDASYVKEGTWVHVSTGKTTSTTSSANSRYNASLACSRLTGIVISPNKTFSWLNIMGSCSKEKGFKESTVFENGKRVKGYGGGVCQVSTTINIAAKNAGIKTNATKHSLPVSYAERKDEATVAYPYVDFSFKNTLNAPLKLVLTASNGSCTCKIYKFVFKG